MPETETRNNYGQMCGTYFLVDMPRRVCFSPGVELFIKLFYKVNHGLIFIYNAFIFMDS